MDLNWIERKNVYRVIVLLLAHTSVAFSSDVTCASRQKNALIHSAAKAIFASSKRSIYAATFLVKALLLSWRKKDTQLKWISKLHSSNCSSKLYQFNAALFLILLHTLQATVTPALQLSLYTHIIKCELELINCSHKYFSSPSIIALCSIPPRGWQPSPEVWPWPHHSHGDV